LVLQKRYGLALGSGHGHITPHSKRYIKSSHYIFWPIFGWLIHQIGKLFTNCSLRARKNYFTLFAKLLMISRSIHFAFVRHAPSF
jgi:hypothetical protein